MNEENKIIKVNDTYYQVYATFRGEYQIVFEGISKKECEHYIYDKNKKHNVYGWIKDVILPLAKKYKKEQFENALLRNLHLTSVLNLGYCEVTTYDKCYYIKFEGTRCNVSICLDKEYKLLSRKPHRNKLRYIDSEEVDMSEGDFDSFFYKQ